ncbi:hypothetical protein F1559_000999 [Cyanidiococcus yangmingshanensis]|uniref:FANCI solenoid 4 domain-containing protein n=1 Tax=Cyanidiococcus yangmingshanensis TaxID=2690220 RepID=A0A7J7IGZ1_9RHOD|nr:hypothetical protein F1559_000999 [Cyanidiococcus yangmingshanensis]
MVTALVVKFRALLQRTLLGGTDVTEPSDWASLEASIEHSKAEEATALLRVICETVVPRATSGSFTLPLTSSLRRLICAVVLDLGYGSFPGEGPVNSLPKEARQKRPRQRRCLVPPSDCESEGLTGLNHDLNDDCMVDDDIHPIADRCSETSAWNDKPVDPMQQSSWPPSEEAVGGWLAQATESSFHERWLLPADEWLALVRESPANVRIKSCVARRAMTAMRARQRLSPALVAAWQPLLLLCGTPRALRLEALACLMSRDRPEIPSSVLELALRRDVRYAKELMRMALDPGQPHPLWHQDTGTALFLLVTSMPSVQSSCKQVFLRTVRQYFADSMEALRTTFPFPGLQRPASPIGALVSLTTKREAYVAPALDLVVTCLDADVSWPVADWSLFTVDAAAKSAIRNLVASQVLERIAAAPALRLHKASWLRFLAAASASQPIAFLAERNRQFVKERILCPETVPALGPLMRHCPELIEKAIYQCRKALFQTSDTKEIHAARALASIPALIMNQNQHNKKDTASIPQQWAWGRAPEDILNEVSRLSFRILESASAPARRAWYESTIKGAEASGLPPAVLDLVRAHIRRTFFVTPWGPQEAPTALPLHLGRVWIEDDLPSLLCIVGIAHDTETFMECVHRLSKMDLDHFDVPADTADEPLDDTDRRVLLSLLDTIETALLVWPHTHREKAHPAHKHRTEAVLAMPSCGMDSDPQSHVVESPANSIQRACSNPSFDELYATSIHEAGYSWHAVPTIAHEGNQNGSSGDFGAKLGEPESSQACQPPLEQHPNEEWRVHSEQCEQQPSPALIASTLVNAPDPSTQNHWPCSRALRNSLIRLHQRVEQRLGDPLMIWRHIGGEVEQNFFGSDTMKAQSKSMDPPQKRGGKTSPSRPHTLCRDETSAAELPHSDRIPVRALKETLESLTATVCNGAAAPEDMVLALITLRRLLLVREPLVLTPLLIPLVNALLQLCDTPLPEPHAETIHLLSVLALYSLQCAAAGQMLADACAVGDRGSDPSPLDDALLRSLQQCAERALMRGLETERWSTCSAGAILLDTLRSPMSAVAATEMTELCWDASVWNRVRRCVSASKKLPVHPAIRHLLPAGSDLRLLFRAALRSSLPRTSWYSHQTITSIASQIIQTWTATSGPDWNVMRLFVLQMQTWSQHFDWLVDRGSRFCEASSEPKDFTRHLAGVWTDWARALALMTMIACGNGVENGSRLAARTPGRECEAPDAPDPLAGIPRVVAVAPWTYIRAIVRAMTHGFQALTRLARAILQKRLALCRSAWKRMVSVASQELATCAYDIMTAASEPTADESSAKIRAECQLFPQMIYALENADKTLLAVSCAYRDSGLVRRMRRPLARDFKLAIS